MIAATVTRAAENVITKISRKPIRRFRLVEFSYSRLRDFRVNFSLQCWRTCADACDADFTFTRNSSETQTRDSRANFLFVFLETCASTMWAKRSLCDVWHQQTMPRTLFRLKMFAFTLATCVISMRTYHSILR